MKNIFLNILYLHFNKIVKKVKVVEKMLKVVDFKLSRSFISFLTLEWAFRISSKNFGFSSGPYCGELITYYIF